MQTEEPVKSGYLMVPGQGFLKKTWNKRYYALYGASNHGLQRLEMFDNEESSLRHSPAKIIPLTDCIKVTSVLQKNQNNVFEIRTKEHLHTFSADSYQEMTDWLSSVQNVAFGPATKPCPSLNQSEPSSASPIISSHHEENLIYCSVDAPEMYPVSVLESEATTRCKLYGNYQLLLTTVGITLSDQTTPNPAKPTLLWSYRHIRRYGYSHTTFSFEAGRKASSGEGLFTFNTKDGATIFQSIATKVDSLKTLKNESDLNSPNAGSENKSFFNSTDTSNRNTLVKSFTEQRHKVITPSAPVAKPPRRSKLILERLPIAPPDANNSNMYENPGEVIGKHVEGDYDEPVERQDAWKTLGKDCNDSYTSAEPTYDDLEFPCVDSGRNVDIGRLCIDSNNGRTEQVSLPNIRKPSLDSGVYGKVNKTRSSSVSDEPNYENLLVSTMGNEKSGRESSVQGVCNNSPRHILCNDDEYAQIIRRKK